MLVFLFENYFYFPFLSHRSEHFVLYDTGKIEGFRQPNRESNIKTPKTTSYPSMGAATC